MSLDHLLQGFERKVAIKIMREKCQMLLLTTRVLTLKHTKECIEKGCIHEKEITTYCIELDKWIDEQTADANELTLTDWSGKIFFTTIKRAAKMIEESEAGQADKPTIQSQ